MDGHQNNTLGFLTGINLRFVAHILNKLGCVGLGIVDHIVDEELLSILFAHASNALKAHILLLKKNVDLLCLGIELLRFACYIRLER